MRVTVRVKPGSSRTRVGGAWQVQDEVQLIVSVTERAVDGAATAGVLRAVARAFRARSSAVRLVSGASRRTKVIEVDVDEGPGRARLDELLHGIPGPTLPTEGTARG